MPDVTKQLLAHIARVRDRTTQRRLLAELGTQEFARCAADIIYWLDSAQHDGIPYAYTFDPHELYACSLCADTPDAVISHTKFKLRHHLELRHGVIPENEDVMYAYYLLIPAIRPFELKEYMVPIIRAWETSQLFAIEKSRDMMATWLMMACITWDVLYHPGREWICQSEDTEKTRNLVLERGWFIYDHQPRWLKRVHPAKQSVGTTKCGNVIVPSLESRLFGIPKGPNQIRYAHPTGVFVDEAAFVELAAESFGAIKPAIQGGGRYCAISSANPGFFQLICQDRTHE